MTQEDKELLIKDLCARLPYGVICEDEYGNVLELNGIDKPNIVTFKCSDKTFWTTDLDKCKPYLLPLSSMTEEQKEEYRKACDLDTEILSKHPMDETPFPALHNSQDWFNAHHFDYRGLIPMGLANDATGLNIY